MPSRRAAARPVSYAEESDSEDAGDGGKADDASAGEDAVSDASEDFEEDDAADDLDAQDDDADDDGNSKPPPLKKRKSLGKSSRSGATTGGEYLIKKLAERSAGKTPYRRDTIHTNTLLFLRELASQNDRDWFAQNELRYRQARGDFESFVEAFSVMLQEVDDEIPALPVKDLTFRIYRDIRFSNDRTPYKTHMSAALSRTGRKGNYACYYIHVEPNGLTQLNCGVWMPEAEDLRKIRRFIMRRPAKLMEVVEGDGFVQFFGGRKAITSTENQLKTAPKGVDKSHKDIDLLKCKTFRVRMDFSDEEATSAEFMQILRAVAQEMVPFVRLLNSVLFPAAGEEHFSESEEEVEEEEDQGNESNHEDGEGDE
ncbi:hypothetical protein PYCC9005_004934 [Savitreella phatthalungensis]